MRNAMTATCIHHTDWLVPVIEVSTQLGYLGFTGLADNHPYKNAFIEKFNQQLKAQLKNGLVEKVIDRYVSD
ncbi:hypothetical protein IX95_26150 [Vibrio sp. B183]|uniref:hypothetical protein n=1 Tax=Vibrio sp. B183 TaxID=1526762 RepID=UPI000503231D|nr:hypothetical protein [Vibrio sp. B183]KFI09114.1 hypothetical protein IX95_26150 [Vibrio sp. B183]